MAENYNNGNLAVRANLPELIVRQVLCGCFTGRWKNRLAVNRLIYIFETGPSQDWIGDSQDRCLLIPGQWLFIPAFHEVEHKQTEGLRLISLHFNVQLYSQLELLGECGRIFQGNSPEAREEFAALTACNGKWNEAFLLHAVIWRFLAKILSENTPLPEETGLRFSRFSRLLEEFGRKPYADFSVAEMARIVKMGRESFVKQFSAETGQPPRHFFNQLRASAAARELADPRVTIREISERFGFTNEFYFSRFFRRHIGTCPSNYRKNLKQ
jgi:AraC-like DNA-binding protein